MLTQINVTMLRCCNYVTIGKTFIIHHLAVLVLITRVSLQIYVTTFGRFQVRTSNRRGTTFAGALNSLISIVLYCIGVGSRRVVPPDALQPKAYCTNPGLQSFLLAPSGVFTRDPSSERRNYLGEKWPMNFV